MLFIDAARRGLPLVTRGGRKAKFVAYNPRFAELNRVMVNVDGLDFPVTVSVEGRFLLTAESSLDILVEKDRADQHA